MSQKYYNENNDEEEIITLTFDDGSSITCTIVAIFPVEGQDYAALLPNEPMDGIEPEELLLYRYVELEGEEVDLLTIDDEDEFDKVADAFDELLDEFEFNNME
jgi:uncharacterized protein YrzB (UPF0473 family)